MTQAGWNTGNLLFFSSVRRVVQHELPSSGLRFDPRTIGDKHDGIIVPAANWLNRNSDFGGLANLIEATKLPCVVIGLGAQSVAGDVPKLTPGTERLIKVLSERAPLISVRGAFTAEVLRHYGVHNVDITGCPSLLWHVTNPPRVTKPLPQGELRISTSGTRSDDDKSFLKPNSAYAVGLHIARIAFRDRLDYVAQTEFSEIRMVLGDRFSESERAEAYQLLQAIYRTDDVSRLEAHIRNQAKVFFDVEDWVAYCKTIDLSVGTRLHGTIASLLAGTPAVLVIHDTRTREMAELAGIPTIEVADMLEMDKVDPEYFREHFDWNEFNTRQKTYYAHFRHFFEKNGIAHRMVTAEELNSHAPL